MTTGRIGRPPIGARYEFARPGEMGSTTRAVAKALGVTEAEITRRAIEIGLAKLRKQAGWATRVAEATGEAEA